MTECTMEDRRVCEDVSRSCMYFDVFVKMSPRILKSLCIWVLILILHNVHTQARVLPCGGGGVRNSDSAGLQEGAGKIMELEKSQLN